MMSRDVCHVMCLRQVEEIVVRPESEITFIKLYDGAVIKGQQVSEHGCQDVDVREVSLLL